MYAVLSLFAFTSIFVSIKASTTINSNLSTIYDITIKTPEKQSISLSKTFKSIHIRYIPPRNTDSWSIVRIKPWLPNPNDDIYQVKVHRCHDGEENLIWYDDPTGCNGGRAMLLYQWTFNASRTKFQISDDLGFEIDRSKSIVLSIVYSKERMNLTDQSGVILTICTLNPRFHVGTTLIGNSRKTTRLYEQKSLFDHAFPFLFKDFSCRSSNYPRLLYAVQPLFARSQDISWNVYVIRNRPFGRKLIQYVLDNLIISKENQTDFELIPSDIFVIPGDYILIQCVHAIDIGCQFLIYYTYKNLQYEYFDEDDYNCENDNYPDLFKLIPLKTDDISPHIPGIDGKTVFLLLCLLLLVLWISIIIGCVIMRRIRGLVNFRAEPITPMLNQANRLSNNPTQIARERQQEHKIAQDADAIAQLDIEHMGLMS